LGKNYVGEKVGKKTWEKVTSEKKNETERDVLVKTPKFDSSVLGAGGHTAG